MRLILAGARCASELEPELEFGLRPSLLANQEPLLGAVQELDGYSR